VADYFEPNDALMAKLDAEGKDELAERLRSINRDWRATVVYQDEPKGLGHAVGCAADAVGNEPFAVMLPDELMGSSALLAQMNGVCAATNGSVVPPSMCRGSRSARMEWSTLPENCRLTVCWR
jgi:UTP--glucose-1-phosphate uridylyltransferase